MYLVAHGAELIFNNNNISKDKTIKEGESIESLAKANSSCILTIMEDAMNATRVHKLSLFFSPCITCDQKITQSL